MNNAYKTKIDLENEETEVAETVKRLLNEEKLKRIMIDKLTEELMIESDDYSNSIQRRLAVSAALRINDIGIDEISRALISDSAYDELIGTVRLTLETPDKKYTGSNLTFAFFSGCGLGLIFAQMFS